MTSSAATPTVTSALSAAQARGLTRLDAQLLLLEALNRPSHQRAWLLAHDTDPIDAATLLRLDALIERRLRGEPVAYLNRHKEFFGLMLQVDARVLVPRPDTETLVDWALDVLPPHASSLAPAVLDLGTGSGAIALAIKSTRPDAQISAIDYSDDALTVARANAHRLGLAVAFSQGSWFAGLTQADARFDVIVSNPPYIAAEDAHLADLTFEPLQALASGPDGLDDLRHIIAQASAHLHPGGWLLLEHGHDQAASVRELLLAAGLRQVSSRPDLAGIERCSGGQAAPV